MNYVIALNVAIIVLITIGLFVTRSWKMDHKECGKLQEAHKNDVNIWAVVDAGLTAALIALAYVTYTKGASYNWMYVIAMMFLVAMKAIHVRNAKAIQKGDCDAKTHDLFFGSLFDGGMMGMAMAAIAGQMVPA